AAAELEARRREWERSREVRARARVGNASPSRPDEQGLKSRDSSIKKNTTLIKKLRTITEENARALLTELSKTNVSKYVSEAALACVEGKMKSSDVNAAVEIISCMHQTYADFAAPLEEALRAYVVPPRPETLLKMAEGEIEALPSALQRRIKLRLFLELHIVGVCPKVKPVLDVVKELARLEYKIAPDLYQHTLSTLSSFAKTFAVEMLGAEPEFETNDEDFVLPADVQQEFKSTLNEYCDRLFLVLMEAFFAMTEQEREIARLLERTGAVSESASVEFAALTKVFDGLLKGATTLAETLGRELPEMKKKVEERVAPVGTMELHRGGVRTSSERSDLWEDEEQRHFYETLPDLQASIPAVLLASDTQEIESETERLKREKEDITEGRTAKLQGLILRLSDCMSKDKADSICTDFCYIGARGGRKRLIQEFLNVRRSEIDRIPFYGRMIATLGAVFDDIAPTVSKALKEDFDYLMKKGTRANLGERLKNIIFIGELVKFGMITDLSTVFEVIKLLVDDFHGDNVDVLCSLFDVAGYYLTRTQTTSKRMGSILDIFLRLKAVSQLDARQCALVDSAYYKCRPVQTIIVRKTRPPMQEYIRDLIFSQLSKRTLEKVATQLRKLPWDETEEYLVKKLLKVCKLRHSSVPAVAALIAKLSQFYPTLAVRCLDAVLEDVRFGLEVNETWMHQRRVANMRLLACLYKERVSHFREILDTLYLIISIGYDGREAKDYPGDTIRLRMVCTLLENALKGHGAMNHAQRKELDRFLIFFQRYALTKDVAVDVANDVVEVLVALNPRMKICETYEEANAECKKLIEKPNTTPGGMETVLEEDEVEGLSESEEPEDEDMEESADEEDEESSVSEPSVDSDMDVNDEHASGDGSEASEEEQEVKVRMKLKQASMQEQRDFEREMNKFLGTPANPALGSATRNFSKASIYKPKNTSGGTIMFKMLVKNQGKQVTKELNVPEGAEFVASVKEVMKAEEAELAEVKRKVLNMGYRDDEDEGSNFVPRSRHNYGWREKPNDRREFNASRWL
ncbi:Up-frameshift suppressor 2, partial [Ostreococcus tauri]